MNDVDVVTEAQRYVAVEATNETGDYADAARIMRGLLAKLDESFDVVQVARMIDRATLDRVRLSARSVGPLEGTVCAATQPTEVKRDPLAGAQAIEAAFGVGSGFLDGEYLVALVRVER